MIEFNEFELELMKKLNISPDQLKLFIKPTKTATSVYTERKVLRTIVTCKLCKKVSHQYMRMVKRDGGWFVEEHIERPPDYVVSELNTVRTTINVCPFCKEVLSLLSKDVLVQMLIDVNMFHETTDKKEVHRKHVNK